MTSTRPIGVALALILALGTPTHVGAADILADLLIAAALESTKTNLELQRPHALAARDTSSRLRADETTLESRQLQVTSEHRQLAAERDAMLAKEAELAETTTTRRRAVASGLIGLLGRARRAPEEPVANQRANLVVAGAVEPWQASEQEQRLTRDALAHARMAMGLLAGERQLLEASRANLDLRRSLASIEAQTAAIRVSDLVTRATLLESGQRRLQHERLILQIATETSLEERPGASARLLALPPVGKPALYHEAELLLATLGSPRTSGRSRATGDLSDRQMIVPVSGEIAERFGQVRNGLRHRGLTLVTDRAQPVQAPRGGVIAFAGAFRSFGLVLIINHGHEYHSLVSGLSRLDVKRGDIVAKGQSIGWLEAGDAGPGSIYLELRHGGEPIDPWPALAAHEDKVRG